MFKKGNFAADQEHAYWYYIIYEVDLFFSRTEDVFVDVSVSVLLPFTTQNEFGMPV